MRFSLNHAAKVFTAGVRATENARARRETVRMWSLVALGTALVLAGYLFVGMHTGKFAGVRSDLNAAFDSARTDLSATVQPFLESFRRSPHAKRLP